MSSRERRIIFHQIFFILSISHASYFACSAKHVDPGLNAIRQTSKADQNSIATLRKIVVLFLVMTVGGLCWPTFTYAASCDALVGKRAWVIGAAGRALAVLSLRKVHAEVIISILSDSRER